MTKIFSFMFNQAYNLFSSKNPSLLTPENGNSFYMRYLKIYSFITIFFASPFYFLFSIGHAQGFSYSWKRNLAHKKKKNLLIQVSKIRSQHSLKYIKSKSLPYFIFKGTPYSFLSGIKPLMYLIVYSSILDLKEMLISVI